MNGYAVFDIETTGFRLHPDSITEIAVVHVDEDGAITGSWDTLLRPQDGLVGPTHVHGISGAMVAHAPSFADLAPQLFALFAGRIPVAHRIAQFDGRFLNAHFTWAGIPMEAFTGGLCTWQLAHRTLPLTHHTLRDCCTHLGIDLLDAHRALDDTIATAHLLGHFIRAGHVSADRPAIPASPTIPALPTIPAIQVPGPRDAPGPWYPRQAAAARMPAR